MDGLTCIFNEVPFLHMVIEPLFPPFGDGAHVAMIPNGFSI
jgi:hypothetical protein